MVLWLKSANTGSYHHISMTANQSCARLSQPVDRTAIDDQSPIGNWQYLVAQILPRKRKTYLSLRYVSDTVSVGVWVRASVLEATHTHTQACSLTDWEKPGKRKPRRGLEKAADWKGRGIWKRGEISKNNSVPSLHLLGAPEAKCAERNPR